MGNPASPILASIVMYDLITEVCKKIPYYIPLIENYVDDTLLAIPKSETLTIVKYFHSYHKLKLTVELESYLNEKI